MVQFQKPKKIYNDRRFFFGSGPGIVPNDNYSVVGSPNADKRGSRSREGSYMPFGPSGGAPKPGLHPAGFPVPRIPLPPFPGGLHSQPYAIPTRGAVHGGPIGGHLSHQQGSIFHYLLLVASLWTKRGAIWSRQIDLVM
ncbi:Regulator of nonsense transcripts 1-like protein [Thalictrum thalictroides]|uniref:Regulator of nonsense transcripts 1-like protein n=1 Tax=Thalictrum thalictroides TaxID=46969 RepID=A0A7J6VGH6_THATH|nr:Regulator of nonsense transcripts 1-like protein [Thalictrum thalictroides]